MITRFLAALSLAIPLASLSASLASSIRQPDALGELSCAQIRGARAISSASGTDGMTACDAEINGHCVEYGGAECRPTLLGRSLRM